MQDNKPRSLQDASDRRHNDFGGGNKRASKSSVDYGDDDEDSRFLPRSSVFLVAGLVLLLAGVLRYRKLQFDRKGIHKRSDSF